MQREAQERLRQLEEEEREAEEKLREGLDLEEGEALPDRATRQRLEQQRLQQMHGSDADAPTHSEGSRPATDGNPAGLTADDHRKQLREAELRVRCRCWPACAYNGHMEGKSICCKT